MTWGKTANTFLTRQLNTYEEAKAHYKSVVPLRKGSSNENARPIGFRRYTWGTIVEGPKDSTGNAEYYAARYYNTDCVIWRQPRNGKEIVDFNCGGYVTPSTAKFMHYICPEHIYCHMELHRIRANGYPIPLTNTNRDTAPEYLTMEGTPDAVRRGNYIWAPLNSTKEYVHQIDRSALNEVRRQFKPFLDWYKGYFKIMEGRIPLQYIKELIGDAEYDHKLTPLLIGGEPEDIKRFLDLVSSVGDSQYESFLHATYWMANVHCHMGGSYYAVNAIERHKKIDIKLADRIIGAVHANKVLIKIPLALGEIRKDKYASWIYNGEQ